MQLQVTLLLLIAAGIVCHRKGWLNNENSKTVSRLLTSLFLPCSVLGSFQTENGKELLAQSTQIALLAVGIHFFYLLFVQILFRKMPGDRRAIFQFATLCPNTNFMGIPIIDGVFGETGVALLSAFLIPSRFFIWTVGISYFTTGTTVERLKELLKNPTLWASILGGVMMAFGLALPSPVKSAVDSLGKCTTPLAMILIGNIVANVKRQMLFKRTVWRYCLLRLLIIPLLVLAVIKLLPVAAMAGSVTVVLTALPAGTLTTVLSAQYGKNEQLAATCVILSTVLSMLTVPFIQMAVQMVLG